MNFKPAALISLAFAASSAAAPAGAQNYPAKPLRMIVPYAPGGGVDIMGRITATRLSERLGVQVVVENRGGAGTVIGTDAVAKAPADGYTLLFGNPALSANPALNDKLPYDTLKHLAPVIMVAASFNVLVVHPSLPVKTVRELVALAK
ncbi:MAG: tripartite tricarboxylate transporter substrate binding protein, partial [Betaproteobacteria bacterium]|nr:tripartite tricarboxylate transporter substrate binding protein [Betaproteobacteria bacterium]